MVQTPGLPTPPQRNPFTGKGLGVSIALLLGGRREQSLAEIAERADVSRALVTMVMRPLLRARLAEGDVRQGRTARVRPTRAMVDELAAHWPPPAALVVGRPPFGDEVTFGGGPAVEAFLPSIWDPPPRAYVRNAAAANGLLADYGGHVVSGGVVDWEIAVVDFPFEPGPLPPILAAVELGSTPRGREMLDRHGRGIVADWLAD